MARSTSRPVAAENGEKITRDDLERKFRSLQDGIRGKVDERRNTIVAVVGAIGFVVVVVVFLLGRKSGKKKTTLVEIRRV